MKKPPKMIRPSKKGVFMYVSLWLKYVSAVSIPAAIVALLQFPYLVEPYFHNIG
jgi:hypothetical protein